MVHVTALLASGVLLGGVLTVSPAIAGPSPHPDRASAVQPRITYTRQTVPDLGPGPTTAFDVDNGRVVGWSRTPAQVDHAILYDLRQTDPSVVDLHTGAPDVVSLATLVQGRRVAGFRDFGGPLPNVFVYNLADPTPAMQRLSLDFDVVGFFRDHVVGSQFDANDNLVAAVVDLSTAPFTTTELGTLGGISDGVGSVASAMDGGLVVGRAGTANGETHAMAYDLAAANPTMLDLGTLGGTSSLATAVDGPVVAGYSALAGDLEEHAFVYDLSAARPRMRDLGTLGGSFSYARAVSGRTVLGQTENADREAHAFLYRLDDARPRLVDLGTLGPEDDPNAVSDVVAAKGRIAVGWSTVADGTVHAWAADLRRRMPRLTDLGPGRPTALDGRDVVGGDTVWTLRFEKPAVLRFARARTSVREADGRALVRVVRRGDRKSAVTVRYVVRRGAGTAEAGQDFVPTRGTLRFRPGQTSRSVRVRIRDDRRTEPAETVVLTLRKAGGGAVLASPRRAVVRIAPSDR